MLRSRSPRPTSRSPAAATAPSPTPPSTASPSSSCRCRARPRTTSATTPRRSPRRRRGLGAEGDAAGSSAPGAPCSTPDAARRGRRGRPRRSPEGGARALLDTLTPLARAPRARPAGAERDPPLPLHGHRRRQHAGPRPLVPRRGLPRLRLRRGRRSRARALRADGIDAVVGHDPRHLEDDVDVLVTTMAVPRGHPEVVRAHELGLDVRLRIELLAELFRRRQAIGITGTHGKSTTTGMAAALMIAAGVDPSVQVGAALPGLVGNMRHGGGPHLVAEVDESDPGFADLRRPRRGRDQPRGRPRGRRVRRAPQLPRHPRRPRGGRPALRRAGRARALLRRLAGPGRAPRRPPERAPLRHRGRRDYRVEDLALRAGGASSRCSCPTAAAPRSGWRCPASTT
jgi:hypothetical protein